MPHSIPGSANFLSTWRAVLFSAALVSALNPTAAQPVPGERRLLTTEERSQGYSSVTVLAKPKAGANHADLATLETNERARLRRAAGPDRSTRILEITDGAPIQDAIARLRASGRYEFVEPDHIVKLDATPNDPRFLNGDQWALRNIGQSGGTAGADIRAEDGWEIRSSASEVVVAVLDSGIRRTHEDIFSNLWINPGENLANASNNRDDDGNGYIDDVNGINSIVPANVSGNGNPTDPVGHGTAVASVIGAVGNNGSGMTGVAWNVKLMILRFIDSDGFGLVSDEIECIDYAIAKRAQIINASFGSSTYSQALFDALKRARDAGIIVVCSAGNDGDNSDLIPHYPSGYLLENIVSVASTTRTDTLSSSSAYGSGLVDLGAPGTSILTAWAGGDRDYVFVSGTSFSAPHVSGAMALVKARFPNESYRETINRVLSSVEQKSALAGKTATGGRLNLAAALRTTSNRPFNDGFAQRAAFAGETGVARASAQNATRETGEPVHAGTAGNGSLWWTWTAPRSGPVTIDTSNGTSDTLLAVYTGSTISALTQVAANDDESATLKTSKANFTATAGTTYQIAVDSKGVAGGLIALRINLIAGNNEFASAQNVSGRSWSIKGDNRVATRETGEPRIRNNTGGRSVWYRWTAPATRRYHIATYSSDFNTMLGIYTGTSITALTEVAAVTTGGDSNYTTSSAATNLNATAGTIYYIVVDSEASSTGAVTVGDFILSCADSEWEFFGVGPISTVAVAPDGTLHATDDVGYLYALNPDGSRKWRFTLAGETGYAAPAVSSSGIVYVGDELGRFYAVNPDGTQKWRTQTQGVIYAAPAIAPDGTVYVRSEEGRLHAFNPDNGTIRWSYRLGVSPTFATYSSPSIATDGTIYCIGSDSKLHAVNPDGTVKWIFTTDFMLSSPAIAADGTIYVSTLAPTRRFYALRPDGTQKWEFIVGDGVSSSAAIGLDGTIYFGSYDKKLYALSPAGQLRWTYETGGIIAASSPVVASDGSIIIGSDDRKIHVVEPGGTLRRTYATANAVRGSPVLYNGQLIVPSFDYRLYSFDVGQVAASTDWPMHRQNLRRSSRLVVSALAIGAQPRPQSAEVSDAITFTVGAVGTAPLTYQWLFNGQLIAGATATTYRVEPVTHANVGQYSARVTDSTGTLTSANAALAVTTPLVIPSVATAPVAQSPIAGLGVTLSVSASGTFPITYQWLRDGVPISGATATTYAIDSTRFTDSGNYAVRITNFAGSITSATAAVSVLPVGRIANMSIRSQVGGTAGILTVGITVGGVGTDGPKPLLLRAVGPTLSAFGVPGTLADPQFSLLSGQTVVAQNDDWAGNAQVIATNAAVGAFALASATSKDAALAQATTAGGYTMRITGAPSTSGVALAEVYDASPADAFIVATPRLINVSALTQVGTGGDILITGFSIIGATPKTVLVRGIGPTLAAFGVVGALADPKLELFASGATTAMANNDNWNAAANAALVASTATSVGAFALAPDSKDAVLLISLAPGSYTAQVSGVGNTTGLALVEVYEVP